MTSDSLLRSLRAAVEAAPDDVALRVHLAELLAAAGERDEAVRHAAAALQRDPANAVALELIARSNATREHSAPDGPEASPGSPLEAETLRQLDSELADVAPPMYAGGDPQTGVDACGRVCAA